MNVTTPESIKNESVWPSLMGVALVVTMTAGVPERTKQGQREAGNVETEPEQAVPEHFHHP